MNRRGETASLLLAGGLLVGGLVAQRARGLPLGVGSSAVYLPAGLWLLAGVNARLRSRVLAWSLFTFALVLAFVVFGAWVLASRVGGSAVNAGSTVVLYAALSSVAAFQLRVEQTKEMHP